MTLLAATFLTVTNVAGAVTGGEYVRADAKTLTLRTGTAERTFPWTALRPEERERILIAADALPPPPAVKSVYARLDEETARIGKMREGGWLTAEAAARQLEGERRNAARRLEALAKARQLTSAAAAYYNRKISNATGDRTVGQQAR